MPRRCHQSKQSKYHPLAYDHESIGPVVIIVGYACSMSRPQRRHSPPRNVAAAAAAVVELFLSHQKSSSGSLLLRTVKRMARKMMMMVVVNAHYYWISISSDSTNMSHPVWIWVGVECVGRMIEPEPYHGTNIYYLNSNLPLSK